MLPVLGIYFPSVLLSLLLMQEFLLFLEIDRCAANVEESDLYQELRSMCVGRGWGLVGVGGVWREGWWNGASESG